MDEGQTGSNVLPPFLSKTYEMVDDPSTDSIVSWGQSNKSFIVWNPLQFATNLLPQYFKHNNFPSFIRQLNTYGFRKSDPKQWEFANDDFVRGQPQLLKNIHRRKPVYSHSLQTQPGHGTCSSALLTDLEKQGYKDEIERLKCEGQLLLLGYKKHKEEQPVIDSQARVLAERLLNAEQRHRDMLSFLAQNLQKPGLSLDLVPLSEIHERKIRISRNNKSSDDRQMIIAESAGGENQNTTTVSGLWKDSLEQLDSSLRIWENIILEIRQAQMERNSSIELNDTTTSCVDSPTISYTQLNIENVPRVDGLDMNSDQSGTALAAAGPMASVVAGPNDVFWEQFLTEIPGSGDVGEVQYDRKDAGGKMETMLGNFGVIGVV